MLETFVLAWKICPLEMTVSCVSLVLAAYLACIAVCAATKGW